MKRKTITILIVLSLFLVEASSAQSSELQIKQMEIDIWPEYDQPSILVIFRISLSSIANLPARISLRIPASAGNPYSVAMKDLDGLLYDLEYSVIEDGDWNRIEFVTSSQDLQIEFYQPYEQLPNTIREYDFHWISDYLVDSLSVNIQEPKYTTQMSIQPDAGEGIVNPADGLRYYSVEMGKVNQGSTVDVKLTYVKANNILSASTMSVSAVNPLPEDRSMWQILLSIFPPILKNKGFLIASLLLFAGMLLFAFLSTLIVKTIKPRSSKSNPDETKQKSLPASKATMEVYCHQCGKRARPGDSYCRTCGSKIIE